MKLRNYQIQSINKLRAVLATGFKSPVLVLPCGAGKSVVCAEIAKLSTNKNNKVLFIVHRIELIDQIRETFNNYGVPSELCDIAMIQSAHKLTKDYNLIITDESHHATANTYQRLYERYPNAYRVNVTATPCRNDGRGLGETCDYLISEISVKQLIAMKFLAPYKYYGINLLDTKPEKVRGEYEDLTEKLSSKKIYGDVLKYYKPGSKVICYCSSLTHSQTTVDEFNNRGIPSAHIDGNTPKEERKEIIKKFRSGEIKVLSNYALLGEGFDVPDCDTVFLLRKTASLNLFIQMSMRCMRYQPNKTAFIYDFCGNCYEHGLPDDDREWNLDSNKKIKTNPDSEPDVMVRICKNCFLAYNKGAICPYCGFDNGLTAKEIKVIKEAELIEIKKIQKKENAIEKSKLKTINEIIEYAVKKNYALGWVFNWAKIKKIKHNIKYYDALKIYDKLKKDLEDKLKQ